MSFTSPAGMQRGTSSIFLIEGTGLAGASEIVFSEPGLVGKILEVGKVPESRLALETKVTVVAKPYFEDPVKMQARVEIRAEDWMATGTHLFRMITPRGSSTPGGWWFQRFRNATSKTQMTPCPLRRLDLACHG